MSRAAGERSGADRVHVSLAELRTATSRALAGAGAPDGTERDGARSVVWLESRRLRGVAALLSDLRSVPDVSGTPAPRPGLVDNRVDLAGCPILIWGSTLIEAAILEAGAAIVLEGCRSPRALLPEAAAQAGPSLHFTLQAGASRALVTDGGTTLDRSFADLDTADVRLAAAPGRPPPPASLPPAPPRARLSARQLDERHRASLARGLRLAPGDWREIREAAARILVPATERSHSRGAGAEVDDNE